MKRVDPSWVASGGCQRASVDRTVNATAVYIHRPTTLLLRGGQNHNGAPIVLRSPPSRLVSHSEDRHIQI